MRCGPRTMVYIQSLNHARMSLADATKLCKTNKYGTLIVNLKSAFESLGYETEIKENITWEQLQYLTENYWPIIQWYSVFLGPADGHYSIVMEAQPDRAKLYDPDFGRVVTYPRQTVEALWVDFDDYGGDGSKDWIRSALLVKKPTGDKTSAVLQSLMAKAGNTGKRGGQQGNQNASGPHTYYHATKVETAQKMLTEGIVPQIGSDDKKPRTYVSASEPDVHYYGWIKNSMDDAREYAVVKFHSERKPTKLGPMNVFRHTIPADAVESIETYRGLGPDQRGTFVRKLK